MIAIAPASPPSMPDAAPPATAPTLGQQFTTLAADLGRTDEVLTSMAAAGNSPTAAWSGHMDSLATRILDARDGLRDQRRDQVELATRFAEDLRLVAEAGGTLAEMALSGSTPSSDWGLLLDRPIADALEAAKVLGGAPKPEPAPHPGPKPKPGPAPSNPLDPATQRDVLAAVALIKRSAETIQTVPTDDTGSDGTRDARIAAFGFNKNAQELLEPHFDGQSAQVVSELRRADASLEDAAWQLAKTPSPDGRFAGVDVPGALHDTQAAADILTALAGA